MQTALDRGGIQLASTERLRRMLAYWPALVLTAIALGSWSVSLPAIDLRGLNDLGLVAVLPPTFYASLALLAAGLALSLRVEPFSPIAPLISILALITVLYGTVPLITDVMSFATAWLHAGFTEAIGRTGQLFPQRDARFDWPGFFAFSAFWTEISGVENPIDIGAWASLILNLLYLPPLLVIFRSVTRDPRVVWLALAVFYSANWVGQDYFSPQGFNFLLYLTTFAVILGVFRIGSADQAVEGFRIRGVAIPSEEPSGLQQPYGGDGSRSHARWTRTWLVLALSLVFIVVASSHQLTPFAAVAGMSALAIFGRVSARGLPVIFIVIVGTWISYMTVTYLGGHIEGILRDVGQPDAIAEATVINRLRGSPDHQVVVQFRLLFTLGIWLLAALGVVRRIRFGHFDLSMVLLAAAPFVLLGLQAYGGEMLLRIYLFSLPFVAFLVAGAFYPAQRPASVGHGMLLWLVLALVLSGFLVARFGNARADILTADEARAAEALYAIAEPDSLFAVGSNSTPLRYEGWEQYRYSVVRVELLSEDPDEVVAALLARDAVERYLFLTRSQGVFMEVFHGLEPGRWQGVLDRMRSAEQFETVYRNRDALVLRLRPPAELDAP